jgi:hypothetical protein
LNHAAQWVYAVRAMNIQFQWTDADPASAHWVYLQRNLWRFVRYFRTSIVAVIVSAIVLFQYPESWQVVGWLIFFDLGTIAYQLFLFRRNTILSFKSSRLWKGIVSITIDGKSIRSAGESFDSVREWTEFSDVVESKRFFMFGTASKKFLYLPKSGMNESQTAELRTLIATYAKGNVKIARPVI